MASTTTLAPPNGGDVRQVSLTVDGSGHVFLTADVWSSSNQPELWGVGWDGTTWGTPQVLNSELDPYPVDFYSPSPAIADDTASPLHVLSHFTSSSATNFQELVVNRALTSVSNDTGVANDNPLVDAGHGVLAFHPDGQRLDACWTEGTYNNGDTYGNTRDTGGPWGSTATAFSAGPADEDHCTLAYAPGTTSDPIVAWHDTTSLKVNGGGATVTLTQADSDPLNWPALAVTQDGSSHDVLHLVGWKDEDSSHLRPERLVYWTCTPATATNHCQDTADWGTDAKVIEEDAQHPMMVSDAAGNLFVSYLDHATHHVNVVARCKSSGTWGSAVEVDGTAGNEALSVTDTGVAINSHVPISNIVYDAAN
ncbi:MAG: hypothetical protein KC656_25540, partial [Myxococcales bacterium]|nr:hypothetical protein [Myxococcales bacterium]